MKEQAEISPWFIDEHKAQLHGLAQDVFSPYSHPYFGPVYEVMRSDRPVQQVQLVRLFGSLQAMHACDTQDALYLFAHDDRKLQGYRKVFFSAASDAVECKGVIYTFDRNNGVASALELVFHDVLQAYANESSLPITEILDDANARALRETEYMYAKDSESVTVSELEAKRMERQRWEHLYGRDSRFPFLAGKRTVYPRRDGNILSFNSTDVVRIVNDNDSTERHISLFPSSNIAQEQQIMRRMRISSFLDV